jgi:hypothetical protein
MDFPSTTNIVDYLFDKAIFCDVVIQQWSWKSSATSSIKGDNMLQFYIEDR